MTSHPDVPQSIRFKNIFVAILILFERYFWSWSSWFIRNQSNDVLYVPSSVSACLKTLSSAASSLQAALHIPKGIVGKSGREWYASTHSLWLLLGIHLKGISIDTLLLRMSLASYIIILVHNFMSYESYNFLISILLI